MKISKTMLFRYGMLGISIIFYLFWFFVDGIRMAVDANAYINFSMSRAPLYPTFLALCRHLFGQNYFGWVGFLQSLFWAYVSWYFSDTIYQKLRLDKCSYVVLLGINFMTCLSTRLFAGRHAMYFLDIASEGLAIPLFLLFVTKLFLYVCEQNNKNIISVIVCGMLLLCVRKQMYIVILIMGITFGLLCLIKQINLKKLLILWTLTIVTFVGSICFDMGYNFAVRGEAVRHSTDSSALLINAIFAATENDAIYIEDEEVRQIFLEIVSTKKENGWGYEESGEGLRELSSHYAQNFDNIAFGIVNPTFYEFLEEQGIEDYVELELAFGELNDYMFSSIISQNYLKMLHVFMANAIVGACNTIAKDIGILLPGIILIYILFVVSVIYLVKKEKITNEVSLAMLTVVCVVINIAAVSVMIFAQSRYMIYNMTLFYCSLYVMLRRMVKINIGTKREKTEN